MTTPPERIKINQSRIAALASVLTLSGVAAASAQGMMMDYAADPVIQKYQSSSCEQLKQMRDQPPTLKEKEALDPPRSDSHARIAFSNKIAAPVAIKMFECGMFP